MSELDRLVDLGKIVVVGGVTYKLADKLISDKKTKKKKSKKKLKKVV